MSNKPTKGDIIQWLGIETVNAVMSVINKNQWRRRPYYIMLEIRRDDGGQPVQLHQLGHQTKEVSVEGKKLIHKIISLLDRDLGPRLNTVLWRVDNRLGKFDLVRSLPLDYPFAVEDSDNAGIVVEKVAQEADKIKPAIMWN